MKAGYGSFVVCGGLNVKAGYGSFVVCEGTKCDDDSDK